MCFFGSEQLAEERFLKSAETHCKKSDPCTADLQEHFSLAKMKAVLV